MLLAYLLASAWAMSAVVGRSANMPSSQMIFEKEEKTAMISDETSQVMAIGDRSSNLKYVMVIQGLMIWEKIKTRSLKVKGLDGRITEKSPDQLTDQELAQLKQAYQDGLKCVAVDQLLVLKQIKEPLTGGKVSVRTVITKITQVLTKYTTEYHEDVYQYEEVQQSDDQSKVYETVTKIVEDNKELCKIDLTPKTEESHPKKGNSNTIPAVVNNNSTVNYNTTENYNINNGTINSVAINNEPLSGDSVDGDRNRSSVNTNAYGATTDGTTGGEFITNGAENDAQSQQLRPSYQAYDTEYQTENAPRTTDNYSKLIDQPMVITDRPLPGDGDFTDNGSATNIDTRNSGHGRRSPYLTRPIYQESAANNKIVLNNSSANAPIDNRAANGVDNNAVELNNGLGSTAGGENNSDSDIISTGSFNKNSTNNGMTENGYLNNGNMKVMNVDDSNRNKGTIKGAKAKNGIINVGTTNNGSVTYGKSNNYTNNGITSDVDSHKISQYVYDIDKMYSTILKEFSKM